MSFTKEKPGSYRDMIKYLCELDGICSFKDTIYNTVEEALKHHKARELIIPAEPYNYSLSGTIQMGKGGVKVLLIMGNTYSLSHVFGNVTHREYATIKDVKTQPENVGKYKNCEGGEWYCYGTLYKVNDKYFTNSF